MRAEFEISPKDTAEKKCEKRSFARSEHDGARRGREIFQQKNTRDIPCSQNLCFRFFESIKIIALVERSRNIKITIVVERELSFDFVQNEFV